MLFLESYDVVTSPSAACAEIQDMLNSFYMGFNVSIYALTVYEFAC